MQKLCRSTRDLILNNISEKISVEVLQNAPTIFCICFGIKTLFCHFSIVSIYCCFLCFFMQLMADQRFSWCVDILFFNGLLKNREVYSNIMWRAEFWAIKNHNMTYLNFEHDFVDLHVGISPVTYTWKIKCHSRIPAGLVRISIYMYIWLFLCFLNWIVGS